MIPACNRAPEPSRPWSKIGPQRVELKFSLADAHALQSVLDVSLHEESAVRGFLRVSGWLLLMSGLLLCMMGIVCLPAGGLMFALPYLFLIPGSLLFLLGGILIFLTRVKPRYSLLIHDSSTDI